MMKKSQVLKLFLIAALLIITPLLSTSLRSTYLYFIVNILIVLVGADAGLLSFFLASPENKQPLITVDYEKVKTPDQIGGPKDKVKDRKVIERPPSTPSIFFIGGGEADDDVTVNGDADESEGQELFHKAETFIGNFYKQLKMQREESWKKLHDLYHKAF